MKRLLLIGFNLLIMAYTHAQTDLISFSFRDVPIERIFKEIDKQTPYKVFCDRAQLANIKNITLTVYNITPAALLRTLFKDLPLDYTTIGFHFVIKRKDVLPNKQVEAKQNTSFYIRGRVTNEENEPVAGAAVKIKDSNSGTITDSRGEFGLNGANLHSTLVITDSSYEPYEEPVNLSNGLSIQLKRKASQLQEVYVIGMVNNGYQLMHFQRTTGAYSLIDNALFNRAVGPDVLTRIENIVTGLSFRNPGDGMLMRGRSSINANVNPLVIVDNFPYDGDINNINPNDVENITILKDAAAASIWGARSGNGVIVITTKKGKAGKPKMNWNINATLLQRPDLSHLSVMSSADEIDLEEHLFSLNYYDSDIMNNKPLTPVVELLIARKNQLISEQEFNDRVYQLKRQNVYKDVAKYFFRPVINLQNHISISYANAKSDHFIGIGWDKNNTNLVGENFNRFTIKSNNNYGISKKLKFSLGTYVVLDDNSALNNPGLGLNSGAEKRLYPYARLVDDSGNPAVLEKNMRLSYADTLGGGKIADWHYRPIADMRDGKMKTTDKDITINAGIDYYFNSFASISLKYQLETMSSRSENIYSSDSWLVRNTANQFYQPDENKFPVPIADIGELAYKELLSHQGRVQFNYNRNWSPKHKLTGMAAFEIKSTTNSSNGYRKYNYDGETDRQDGSNMNFGIAYPIFNDPGGAPSQIANPQFRTNYNERFTSLLTNVSYTYDNRYNIYVSARHDATNLFGVRANQRGVPLWSVGANWRISNENFYYSDWLTWLDLDASFGYNGNFSRLASPKTSAIFSTNAFNVRQATLQDAANDNLKWERVRALNIGVKYEVKTRLNGSFNYFSKKSLDMLAMLEVNPTIGLTPPYPAAGEAYIFNNGPSMTCRGFEFEVNSCNIDRQFKWYTTFLYTQAESKISQYANKESTDNSKYLIPSVNPVVGKPLYGLYSYRWAGLDPANGDPLGYVNNNKTNNWNDIIANTKHEDLVYNGPTQSPKYGSFRNTFSYKNVSLSAMISFKLAYYLRKPSINYADAYDSWTGHSDYKFRWQNPGDEQYTIVPSRPDSIIGYRDQFYLNSNALAIKGDHVRLEDLRLDYNIPIGKNNRLFEKVTAYAFVSNIGVIWKANKYLDPYYPDGYKPQKTVTVGVSVQFI